MLAGVMVVAVVMAVVVTRDCVVMGFSGSIGCTVVDSSSGWSSEIVIKYE